MNIILVKLLILSNLISYLYTIIQLYITNINPYYMLLILQAGRADLTLNSYLSARPLTRLSPIRLTSGPGGRPSGWTGPDRPTGP
jgi:hypothetical protein